jgi:hypothetical protein
MPQRELPRSARLAAPFMEDAGWTDSVLYVCEAVSEQLLRSPAVPTPTARVQSVERDFGTAIAHVLGNSCLDQNKSQQQ